MHDLPQAFADVITFLRTARDLLDRFAHPPTDDAEFQQLVRERHQFLSQRAASLVGADYFSSCSRAALLSRGIHARDAGAPCPSLADRLEEIEIEVFALGSGRAATWDDFMFGDHFPHMQGGLERVRWVLRLIEVLCCYRGWEFPPEPTVTGRQPAQVPPPTEEQVPQTDDLRLTIYRRLGVLWVAANEPSERVLRDLIPADPGLNALIQDYIRLNPDNRNGRRRTTESVIHAARTNPQWPDFA